MDKYLENAIKNKNQQLLMRIAQQTICPAVRKKAQDALIKIKGNKDEKN